MTQELTQQRLRELLSYNPETGDFTRIAAPRPQSACYIGRTVGYIKPGSVSSGGGYRMITVDGVRYRAHRLAWLYQTGSWPSVDVDHTNGDRADNRWSNLRAATRSQNLANARRRSNNTSGIKGVSWDAPRGKWKAQLDTQYLGRFDTKEEAAAAYINAAEARFGEFARAA